MNRLVGLDREFYIATHGPQIAALTGRVDQLLDGRLPRLKAVAAPGEPAQLVDGHQTEASAEQRLLLEGIDTGVLGISNITAYATSLDAAHSRVADTMIKSTVELTKLGRSVSKMGLFLRNRNLESYIPPVTYQYATWAQTSLRVAGGFLAICSATHLEGSDQNNSNYHITIDDNTTRQSLAVAVTDDEYFSVNLDVESSHDALFRQCQQILDSDGAQSLLLGAGEGNFDVAEQISTFLADQRANRAAWLDSYAAASFVRRIHERALAVRRTREQLAMHIDLPNRQALHRLSTLLGARIVSESI